MVTKPEAKWPHERPSSRWEYNIKKYLQEMGYKRVDWIHLAQYRVQWRALVNTVINLRVPLKAGKFWRGELPSASQEELCSVQLVGQQANKLFGGRD
jgi:hypothetical protein